MDLALVERAKDGPVDGHEQEREDLEGFLQHGKADAAEHLEDVVRTLRGPCGRFHLAECRKVRLDVGVEVGEGKRVARLFGKFGEEREECIAAVVHACEIAAVKAQRTATELLRAIPEQVFAVRCRERIWQGNGRHGTISGEI